MMPNQCRQVLAVAASAALGACFRQKRPLPRPAAHLLLRVALMAMIRVGILATARTEALLPATERGITRRTTRKWIHKKRIIHLSTG